MIRKIFVGDKSHEEWMKVRAGTIGGSQAGVVVGLSPYQSRFSLWTEMTGRSKAFEGNLATEVGTYLEEFVAKKFEKETGLSVQKSNYIYFNDKFPNQHATPDRVLKKSKTLNGLKCGLEIKTTNGFGRLLGGDQEYNFPAQYYAQCVQYLSVMEYDIWFLAVLVGNREFHIFELRRDSSYPVPDFVEGSLVVDDDEINNLRDACDEFMNKYVRPDVAPLADGSESTTNALDDAYPEAETDSKTWLNGQEQNLIDLMALKTQKRDLELEIDRLTNILKAEMGEYETAGCGAYTVTWKNSYSGSIDSKRLKAERPDIYEAYYRKTACRKFSVK